MANQIGSAKAKDNPSSKDNSPSVQKDNSSPVKIDHRNPRSFERLNDKIARRAYRLYKDRGNPDGKHLEHWFEAESEFSTRPAEIRESSSWYTVNVPLRGFAPEDVSVGVEPRRAVVVAEKEQHAQTSRSSNDLMKGDATTQQSICLVAVWPSDVDPATASAYVKNGTLTLTVKRAAAEQS